MLQEKKILKGISGSTLKIIAIFCMLMDHIAASMLYEISIDTGNTMLFNISRLMRGTGRLAFPIFCFLLVEGIIHTRDRKKYALRLGLFALISEIPFDLAINNKLVDTNHQNVFFTLFIGVLVVIALEKITNKYEDKKRFKALAIIGVISLAGVVVVYFIPKTLDIVNYILKVSGKQTEVILNEILLVILLIVSLIVSSIVYKVICNKKSKEYSNKLFAKIAVLFIGILIAVIFHTDYGDVGIITIAVMYKLHKDRIKSMLGGCLALSILIKGELVAFFDVILVYFYNGKRGLNMKYLFYAFYPLHLLILYFVHQLIK